MSRREWRSSHFPRADCGTGLDQRPLPYFDLVRGRPVPGRLLAWYEIEPADVARLRYSFRDFPAGIERHERGAYIVHSVDYDERAVLFIDGLPLRAQRNLFAVQMLDRGRLLLVWRKWRRYCSAYHTFSEHRVGRDKVFIGMNADFRTRIEHDLA